MRSPFLISIISLASFLFAGAAQVYALQTRFDLLAEGRQGKSRSGALTFNADVQDQLQINTDHDLKYKLQGFIQLLNDAGGRSSKSDFNQAKLDVTLNEDLYLTFGLEVYQWGPAEILCPSNPLTRSHLNSQDFNFQEKGDYHLRLNYSPQPENSVVLISQPINNGEFDRIYQHATSEMWLAKVEHRLAKAENNLGLSFGQELERTLFLAGYATYHFDLFTRDASLFFDARQSDRDLSLRPNTNSKMARPIFAVIGLRLESESYDLRFETIYNDDGMTSTEQDQSLKLVQLGLSPAIPLEQTGRDLSDKHYGYSSLRVPNFLKIHDLTLSFRLLTSLDQDQKFLSLAADRPFSDHLTAYILYTRTSGHRFASTDIVSLGARFTF